MTEKTQKELILDELKSKGYVSRNWALRNYITRLGALILFLKQDGIEFDDEKAGYVDTESGKDYRYYLKTKQEPVNGSLFGDSVIINSYKKHYEI